jgi:hypothetical protein
MFVTRNHAQYVEASVGTRAKAVAAITDVVQQLEALCVQKIQEGETTAQTEAATASLGPP